MSQQINLFNPIFRQQKKYLSARTIAQALGLILLGTTLLAGYVSYRSIRLQADAESVAAQLKAAQDRLTQTTRVFPPRQKSAALEQEISRVEADMQSLQKVVAILDEGELGNTDGYADYFRAFARQIVDGVWLTGLTLQGAGTEIALQGRALRPEAIPLYINRLKSERLLQGKSFSNLEMKMPQSSAVGSGVATASQPANSRFIEFTLQSTGLSKKQADAGAQDR